MLLARRVENVARARDDAIADLTDIRRRMRSARTSGGHTDPDLPFTDNVSRCADSHAHDSNSDLQAVAAVADDDDVSIQLRLFCRESFRSSSEFS